MLTEEYKTKVVMPNRRCRKSEDVKETMSIRLEKNLDPIEEMEITSESAESVLELPSRTNDDCSVDLNQLKQPNM